MNFLKYWKRQVSPRPFSMQQAYLSLYSRERSRIQVQRTPTIPGSLVCRQVSPRCHPSTRQSLVLGTSSSLEFLLVLLAGFPAAMSFPRSEDVIRFFADEELAGTNEDKFIAVGLDVATLLSSPFCSCTVFAIFLEQVIKLEFLVQQVELKWLILNRWRRLFPLITCEIPFGQNVFDLTICVNVSNLNLGSRLILSNNQSSATLWVLDTCLIGWLLPLIIICITASLSSNTYNMAEIVNVSQIGITFHGISAHHSLPRPDCNSTADVPSFTLRTALSAIPSVSDLCGVDVQWFRDNSSQDLPNSKELAVQMTFGFLVGARNFTKFFWVSWEVLVLHGYDCNHCIAKSCNATAYRWLLLDSLSSLGILFRSSQATQSFRSGHGCTSTFSERGPWKFSSSRFRNLGISGSESRYCAGQEPSSTFVRRVSIDFEAQSFSVAPTTFIDQLLFELLQPIRQLMQQIALADILRKVRLDTMLSRTWFHSCSRLDIQTQVSPWLCRTTFIDQILFEILKPVRQVVHRSLCPSSRPSFLFLFSVSVGLCSGFL